MQDRGYRGRKGWLFKELAVIWKPEKEPRCKYPSTSFDIRTNIECLTWDVFLFWVVSYGYCCPSHSLRSSWFLHRNKTRTFKPRKDVPEGTKQYQLRKYAEATLVSMLVAQPSLYILRYASISRDRGTFAKLSFSLRARISMSGSPSMVCLASHALVDFENTATGNWTYGAGSCWFLQSFKHVIRNRHWVLHTEGSKWINWIMNQVYLNASSCSVQWCLLGQGSQLSVNLFDALTTGMLRYEYLWEDGVTYKRPTKLSAPDYVDTLMNWVQSLLDDENVFPHKIGT